MSALDQRLSLFSNCGMLRSRYFSWFVACICLLTASERATATDGVMIERDGFDEAKKGALSQPWLGTKTGKGAEKWTIENDDTAPSQPHVLKQGGDARFPVALKTDTQLKDGFVEVSFKAISGKIDQAAGVVWRAQDARTYYISRANALENNVTIYHTIKGRRVEFVSVDTEVTVGQWHVLRVDFKGPIFKVSLDGEVVFTTRDERLTEAGMVGVWTKADSVTLFDDFTWGTEE